MESPESLLDTRHPGARVEIGIARAEHELRASVRATAGLYLAVHNTLREAHDFPETFVPAVFAQDADASEFAVRGAVLDLAVRMAVAEQTVRAYDHTATTLLARAPRVWSLFSAGEISVANARFVSEVSTTLPQELWAPFDEAALASAALAPARFKTRLRTVRAKLQPDAGQRHRSAATERRAWIDRDADGMSYFGVFGPAEGCERAMANVDRQARELQGLDGETRTLQQLRADVAIDLLAGKLGSGTGVGVAVSVTIPVMTMLGHSDEPALLEGYGPIDAETARELTAHAPSVYRILTHPVTGHIVDVDQITYRPNTRLERAVRQRDQQCTIPGCGRRAVDCDLDHTIAWPAGPTSYSNLKALCRDHHRVKHKTAWKSEQDAAGNTTFTSPTGFRRAADPPPF